MNHFCTLSDKNWLHKGLAMYLSLQARVSDFTLHYLCIDDETYNTLSRLVQQHKYKINPIKLDDLLRCDVELQKAKTNPPGKYGDVYSQFCWTLTPYFTWWLLTYKVPLNDWLYYADSDLLFYGNPLSLGEKAGQTDYSVAIHSHRQNHANGYKSENSDVGYYNVGLIMFKNNSTGKAVAEWWKKVLLSTTHQYYELYGTCGDQKYLDLFIPLFGRENTLVWDEALFCSFAHGAPWNFDIYEYGEKPTDVKYKGREETILLNHFSHFTPDLAKDTWSSSYRGEWKPEEVHRAVRWFYQDYFEKIKEADELINPLSPP